MKTIQLSTIQNPTFSFHLKLKFNHKQELNIPTLIKFCFQLDREDPDLHDFLERSEVGTIFALPWLITW